MEILDAVVLVVVGVVAGVVNTAAGGGSLLTLPALIFFADLSAPVANGTNRIGVLLQSSVGARDLYRALRFPLRQTVILALPAVASSMAGAYVASRVEASSLEQVLGGALLAGAVLLLTRPRRLLKTKEAVGAGSSRWKLGVVLVAVGFYGGFLQAGVGVLFILALVLVGSWELLAATGAKNLIIAMYTIPSLAIFAFSGQVDWGAGLVLGMGSMVGGKLGARLAVKQGSRFVLVLVVAAVLLASFKLLGVFRWLGFG